MSEGFFAEATVHLVPDIKGFVGKLRSEVKAAIEQVEETNPPKVRIAPALTKNFVGSLRTQVNTAVLQAQKGVKPIRVSVAVAPIPAGVLREVQRATRVVGVGAVGGVGKALSTSTAELAGNQKLVNALMVQGAADLSVFARTEGDVLAKQKERSKGTRSSLTDLEKQINLERDLTESEKLERTALRELAAATAATGEARRRFLLSGQRRLQLAGVVAAEEAQRPETRAQGLAVQARTASALTNVTGQIEEDTRARDEQRKSIVASNKALREQEAEMTRSARSVSQLRRGALATSLSFLGIRGATLAASASFLAGAAAIAVFSKALDSASKFNDQLNVFRATTGATAQELNQVRDAARALGADIKLPGVTAGDAAESMTELAKAGLSVQDSIAGARGVLQLATAAAIDNAQAVQLAANAINAFGLAGKDATHVADVFANAANAAQGSIVDIGLAFQQSAAAGRQVGLSFEDTSVFLTDLARNGLKGSDAGTSLRTALIRLINPSKEAAAKLKDLGIQLRDTQGNLRPDVFIQLAQATKQLAPAERDAIIALIGGQDAFRAISILGRQSIGDFIKMRQELRKQGTASDLAAARMQGLRGSLEALSNTLSSIGIRVGQSVTPTLQHMTDGITAAAVSMSQSQGIANLFSGALKTVELAITGLGAAITTVGPLIAPFASALSAASSAIGIPTIVAAVAAYKLLPPVFLAARVAAASLATTFVTLRTVGAGLALQGGLSALAASLTGPTGIAIAAGAAAAGLFFLLTRENATEAATKRLTAATTALADAQAKFNASQKERRDTALGVNQQRLNLLEAQSAAARARANVRATDPGTFDRTKASLELAVALDNVKIAQNQLTDAVKAASAANEAAAQDAANRRRAAQEEISSLQAIAKVRRDTITAQARFRPPAEQARIEQTQVREFVKSLQDRAQALREENTTESRALAKRIELIAKVASGLKKLPTNKAIEVALTTPNLANVLVAIVNAFGKTGKAARKALLDGIRGANIKINDVFPQLQISFGREMQVTGDHGGAEFARATAAAMRAHENEVRASARSLALAAADAFEGQAKGLQSQLDVVTIAGGGDAARLAVLQQIRAKQQAALDKIDAEIAKHGETPTLRKRRREARSALASTVSEITSITESQAADAKAAGEKAAQDAADATTAFIDGFRSRREGILRRRLDRAGLTETLSDDIRLNVALRKFLKEKIKAIQDRIVRLKLHGEALKRARAAIRAIQDEIFAITNQIAEDQKNFAAQQQQNAAERSQLNIEFAQISENTNAEIKARQAEIRRLKNLQAHVKKGTLEYLRLRNLIAEQQKAIDDLRKKNKETADTFRQMTFEFLTRQQGFAATVMGNLVPGGLNLTGGIKIGGAASGSGAAAAVRSVTGGFESATRDTNFSIPNPRSSGGNEQVRDPRGALAMRTAEGAAGAKGGTPAQFMTIINLLSQMVLLLGHQEARTRHPESARSRQVNNAAMEGMAS